MAQLATRPTSGYSRPRGFVNSGAYWCRTKASPFVGWYLAAFREASSLLTNQHPWSALRCSETSPVPVSWGRCCAVYRPETPPVPYPGSSPSSWLVLLASHRSSAYAAWHSETCSVLVGRCSSCAQSTKNSRWMFSTRFLLKLCI